MPRNATELAALSSCVPPKSAGVVSVAAGVVRFAEAIPFIRTRYAIVACKRQSISRVEETRCGGLCSRLRLFATCASYVDSVLELTRDVCAT